MACEEVVVGSHILVAYGMLLRFQLQNTIKQQEWESAIETIFGITVDQGMVCSVSFPMTYIPLPMRKDLLDLLNVLQSLEGVSRLFKWGSFRSSCFSSACRKFPPTCNSLLSVLFLIPSLVFIIFSACENCCCSILYTSYDHL